MQINPVLWFPLIFLVACGQENAAPAEPTADPTPEVVIIGPTADYPEGCQPNDVASLLLSFLAAYNTGDVTALDHVFAEQIKWYSDGDGNLNIDGKSVDFFTTYERAEMFPYFASRQEQQERLTLLWLSVVPKTWHGGVDIVYTLRREADDLETGDDGRSRLAMGKGAVRCPERKIFVWSMGTMPAWETADNYAPGCYGGSVAGTAGKIVVCANGTQ
jgi:hypothetical protein